MEEVVEEPSVKKRKRKKMSVKKREVPHSYNLLLGFLIQLPSTYKGVPHKQDTRNRYHGHLKRLFEGTHALKEALAVPLEDGWVDYLHAVSCVPEVKKYGHGVLAAAINLALNHKQSLNKQIAGAQ
jgi:hypothetical protein